MQYLIITCADQNQNCQQFQNLFCWSLLSIETHLDWGNLFLDWIILVIRWSLFICVYRFLRSSLSLNFKLKMYSFELLKDYLAKEKSGYPSFLLLMNSEMNEPIKLNLRFTNFCFLSMIHSYNLFHFSTSFLLKVLIQFLIAHFFHYLILIYEN